MTRCSKCGRGYNIEYEKECKDCNLPLVVRAKHVADMGMGEAGHIHPGSKSKESDPPIGKPVFMIGKQDGKYGIILDGKKAIVGEEWAQDHLVVPTHDEVTYENWVLENYGTEYSGLENGYLQQKYLGAFWEDEPTEIYSLADLKDGDIGYVSRGTAGAWSCGIPYGKEITVLENRVGKFPDASIIQYGGRGLPHVESDWQMKAIGVAKTLHGANNLNYVRKKSTFDVEDEKK